MKNKTNKPMNNTINNISIRKVLKLSFLFIVVTTVLVASANSLEINERINKSINIESITSLSNIIDPHYYSLAKIANIDATQRILAGSWSPDGSRLLIVSAIRPYRDVGLTAVYVLNADGSDMKEIASTLNNTRNKSLDMHLGSWSPDGNRIVIPTNIFRVRDFFVIADPDGALYKVVGENLTTVDTIRENILNIRWQRDFSWSPDGTKALVVMGFDPMKSQLYLVDKNGFILRQLTNESIETNVWNPVWSHDGKKIAFNGKNLWVINEDGTGLKQLEQGVDHIYARTIIWSPDDSKIFYTLNRSVYAVNVDGTGTAKIINGDNRIVDDIFSLSPDGRRILFTSSTYNGEKVISKLYVADSDGKNQKLLSEVTGKKAISASWSPKSDKIAFVENDNLYTINPDGSGRATIALTVFKYVWHPSGDYIAFSSAVDKKTGKDVDHSKFWPKEDTFTREVFIARPDGTERVQITSNDQFNYEVGDWSPDGSRLLVNSIDKNDLLVIKFSGYDEVMSIHAPSSVQQGEEFVIEVKSMSKPVENATIFLNGKEIGKTNETGHLKYSFKRPGRYLLNVTKDGYRDASKLVTVKENTQLSGTKITATAVPATDTPKAPGFNFLFSVIALTVIIILRRTG